MKVDQEILADLLLKVDFGASDFEAAVLLQIEVKRKMLGRSVTFGPKSVEKRFQQQNFFELTTPNVSNFNMRCTVVFNYSVRKLE